MAGNVVMVSKAYKEAAVRLAKAAQTVVDLWKRDAKSWDDGRLEEAIEEMEAAIEAAKLPTVQ